MGTEYALERIIRPYPYIWLDWLQKYSADISAWIAEGATKGVGPSTAIASYANVSHRISASIWGVLNFIPLISQ